jgi:hypothetical protein
MNALKVAGRLTALLLALAALAVGAGTASATDGNPEPKAPRVGGDDLHNGGGWDRGGRSDGDDDHGTSNGTRGWDGKSRGDDDDDDDDSERRSEEKSESKEHRSHDDDGDVKSEQKSSKRETKQHESSKRKTKQHESKRHETKRASKHSTSGYIAYCYRDADGEWKLGYATAGDLYEKVRSGDVIAQPFQYEGKWYSKRWNGEGRAIFEDCKDRRKNGKSDRERKHVVAREDDDEDDDEREASRPKESAPAASTCPSGMAAITGSDLSVVQGGVSTGTFTVHSACAAVKVSLVSYSTPWPQFKVDEAHLEKLYDSKTGTFGPGTHSLAVNTPNCYYQVDLVLGDVIPVLGGANGLYGPAGRLLEAVNGGSGPCAETAVAPAPAAATPPAATPVAATPTAAPAPAAAAPAAVRTPAAPAPAAPPEREEAVREEAEVLGAVSPAATADEQPAAGVLGAVARAPEAIAETATAATLPFTGIPLWVAALAGACLLALGIALRRGAQH